MTRTATFVSLLVLTACGATAPPVTPPSGPAAPPEPATAPAAPRAGAARMGQAAEARNGMVVASDPRAAEAGLEMLRRGGNAVDAAVATAFAVGVLEPMMAGIGGGGAMTIWLPAATRAEHVEFYAALGASPDYDLETDTAVTPERGVNVPGTVAGLLTALERWGTLDRTTVMAPAIRLASDGFIVHSLLGRVIRDEREKLLSDPDAAALLYPNGRPLGVGDALVQPALAETLRTIAREGPAAFYGGAVAARLVADLRAGGSTLTLDDFAHYRPNIRRPVCTTYREYTVLTSAPPMGGVTLLETLNLLEPYDLEAMGPPAGSPEALSAMVDAIRIARADRAAWVGDPDETGVPGAGLVSDAYAGERRALIGGPVPDTMRAGDPWAEDGLAVPAACARLEPFPPATLPPPDEPGSGVYDDDAAQTTHLSVVDADRNAVSLTFTMGQYFGTGAYAAGMFLNSAGYNFGETGANVRAPYRTPNSTITPTIVLDGDRARLVVGSPGSGRIPPAVLHTIVYTLDLGYPLPRAVAMPRAYPWTTEPVVQVEDGFALDALAGLRARGYELLPHAPVDMFFGGVSAIHVRRDGWLVGAADPRRDGGARGY